MRIVLTFLIVVAAARAELPIDVPTADTTTNLPPRITVPLPARQAEATNAIPDLPPPPEPTPPVQNAVEPFKRITNPSVGDDSLTFTNGDAFAGTFVGLDGGILHWRSPLVRDPIRFRDLGLDQIALATRVGHGAAFAPEWFVCLNDGSVWPARRLTIEATHLEAELAYFGRVRLERQHIAWLRHCDRTTTEFVTFSDAPVYGQAKYIGQRFRCRDTKLPDPLLIEFPWDGAASQTVLRLFAGNPEDMHRTRASLRLNLSRGNVDLRYTNPQGQDCLNAMLAEPLTNLTVRPTWAALAFNRKSGEVIFYLDGQPLRRGTLTGPFALPDFGLALAAPVFVQRRHGPRCVLVSRIKDDLTLPVPPADQDAVRLSNGDHLTGRLDSVSTNELVFHAAFGRAVLPVERIAQINFTRPAAQPTRPAGALIGLLDGSRLRGVCQRVDAQTVAAQHAVLGPVSFPRAALAELDCETESPATDASSSAGPNLALVRGGLFQARLLRRNDRLGPQPGLIALHPKTAWHGDLAGITNGVVRWQHPAALEPLAVMLTNVSRIAPLPRPLPATVPAERATIRLVNGDVISGPLGPAEGESVRVTPWYSGALSIPRKQVSSVTPHAPATGALEFKLASSVAGNPAPTLVDGALWLDAWRTVVVPRTALPDRMRVDFEAVWGDSAAGRVQLSLFQSAGNGEAQAADGMYVTFQPHGLSLGAADGNRNTYTNFPSGALTNLTNGGSVQLTVLADRSNRQIRVLADGRPLLDWRATDIPVLTGNSISLNSGGSKDTAVRHLILREWRDDPPAPAGNRTYPPAQRTTGTEARVVLHSGDFLTLRDLTADARSVTGQHTILGQVTLSMAAVRSLDWNRPTTGRLRR
jgi:hypothetical protein